MTDAAPSAAMSTRNVAATAILRFILSSSFYQSSRRRLRSRSKLQLAAEHHRACALNEGRPLPGRTVRDVQRLNAAGVEDVENVDVALDAAAPPELHALGEPEVYLPGGIGEHHAGLDQRHVHRS